MWKRRQAAVYQAEARTSTDLELMKERLSDAEARLNATKIPMKEELESLRSDKEIENDALLENQQLWEDERRRFTEQIQVMEERILLSEKSFLDLMDASSLDSSLLHRPIT